MDEDFALEDNALQDIEQNNGEETLGGAGQEESDEGEDEDADGEEEAGCEEYSDHNDEGDDDLEKAYVWGPLPDVCLRHVFRWLGDCDRMNADLVCRHWHSVMRSPSLWRVRCIHLSGRLSKSKYLEHFSTLTYTHYMGRYLESLEVCVCFPPRNSMVAQRLQCTIIGLFEELTRARAQLRSLSVNGLELDRRCWTYHHRNSLVQCLALFLRQGASQLCSVQLRGMRNSLQQGLELLSALLFSQQHPYPRGQISSLDLEKFFCGSLHVHLNPSLPRILHSLQGLTSLTLSYSCLSDELLLFLGRKGHEWRHNTKRDGGMLQTFLLQCHSSEPHGQVVCGTSWASLVSSCPGLKVKLSVVQLVNTDRLARMLLPQIPLMEYTMTACYSSDEEWSAKPVLSDMLPQYRHSLQYLNLDLSNCHETLDEELLHLVKVCVCLQQLKVGAFLEISTVERLLQKRLNKRSCLNNIRVRIYSVSEDTEEEDGQLEEVLSRYPHLPPELEFFAIVYPYI